MIFSSAVGENHRWEVGGRLERLELRVQRDGPREICQYTTAPDSTRPSRSRLQSAVGESYQTSFMNHKVRPPQTPRPWAAAVPPARSSSLIAANGPCLSLPTLIGRDCGSAFFIEKTIDLSSQPPESGLVLRKVISPSPRAPFSSLRPGVACGAPALILGRSSRPSCLSELSRRRARRGSQSKR